MNESASVQAPGACYCGFGAACGDAAATPPVAEAAVASQPTPATCGCGEAALPKTYRYGPAPYVDGVVESGGGPVRRVSTKLTSRDRHGAWRVRWGMGRDDYRVEPGLYAVGSPDADAPVLVTANYKLTFDRLRAAIDGLSAWLLVVDTRGINVWCAAGKGTFSAAEVNRMVEKTRLAEVVGHRRLVLPQLSATGVAAHEVKKGSGFRVVFGPLRATDLPTFLADGRTATPQMRAVSFDLGERLVLSPVELSVAVRPQALALSAGILGLSALGRGGPSLRRALAQGGPAIGTAWMSLLGGGLITPVLLPWLPGRALSGKGATVGAALAAGAVVALRPRLSGTAAVSVLAGVPAATSYVAMNFTGSTPYTSPSGVQREMRRALPFQVAGAAVAVVAALMAKVAR
jgi:CO dehydrogenase/acetyl-CoA synthase delta subunit